MSNICDYIRKITHESKSVLSDIVHEEVKDDILGVDYLWYADWRPSSKLPDTGDDLLEANPNLKTAADKLAEWTLEQSPIFDALMEDLRKEAIVACEKRNKSYGKKFMKANRTFLDKTTGMSTRNQCIKIMKAEYNKKRKISRDNEEE
jgi:hypothetical protein